MTAASAGRGQETGRLVGWLVFIGLFTLLAYSLRLTADVEPERDALYTWEFFVGGLFQAAIMLAIVLALARGPAMRERLALRAPVSWSAAVPVMVLVLFVVLGIGAVLEPVLNASEEQGLTPTGWDPDRATQFLANAAVVAGLVPVVEELTFRGLGYSLLERFGRTVAIVAVGVLFGLAHGLVAGLPILVAFGVALAWLRSRTRSVYPCIVLHGVFNGLALLFSVTIERGA